MKENRKKEESILESQRNISVRFHIIGQFESVHLGSVASHEKKKGKMCTKDKDHYIRILKGCLRWGRNQRELKTLDGPPN